nr:hypothetical protein [bacterium]
MARALPGQTDADPGLIEEALADINAAHDRGGLATMRAIATILLDKMFRDDARAFLETAHAHASFLALAGHPGLAVSKSALWYSVVIEDNFRLFGDLGDELTVSHHKRLSHVPDEDARVALARQVVERRWTVADLEAAIAAARPPRPADAPAGRPSSHVGTPRAGPQPSVTGCSPAGPQVNGRCPPTRPTRHGLCRELQRPEQDGPRRQVQESSSVA